LDCGSEGRLFEPVFISRLLPSNFAHRLIVIPGLKSETWGTRANCVEPDKGFEPNCTDFSVMSLINKALWQQIRTGLIEERVTGKDAPPSE
jgi:hypothetical protein